MLKKIWMFLQRFPTIAFKNYCLECFLVNVIILFFCFKEMLKQTNYFSFLLFAPSLIGFISTTETKVSVGHQSAIDLNKNKLCDYTQDHPKRWKLKIKEIKLNGNKEFCCVCNPGYKVVALCS